jgi:hypothetical protein
MSQTGLVFGLFTGFAFVVMAVASFFATALSPLSWIAFALAIGLGTYLVALMIRI